MDNLNDWLYIVLLAIAGVSSLLSSKKKKNRPTEVLGQPGAEIVTQENSAPQKGFWEILEEMQQKEPEVKPQSVVSKKKNKKQKATTTTPFLSAENELSGPSSQTIANMSILEEEEYNNSPEIELSTVADLRKAVIYAEILNRKY